MTDEEKEAISWLSALDIKSEYEATNKEIVLNLINKQEKAIDRIKEYIHQEIVSREEDIEDYIDDDKEGNKNYIGELKEEKQHWKDIERIIEGKNNEELYMNWWKYGLYE